MKAKKRCSPDLNNLPAGGKAYECENGGRSQWAIP
jgi:hypothetical protein